MALFGGIAHAPLAVMLMVAEMTGKLSLLAPAMIAVAVSTAVVGDKTIYRAQIRDRASSPFHRARFGLPLLSSVRIGEAMEAVQLTIPDQVPVREALARMEKAGADAAVVVEAGGEPIGSVSREALARVPAPERITPVSSVTVRTRLRPGESLEDGMRLLAEAGTDTAPVVDGASPRGLVTAKGILRAYRKAASRTSPRSFPAEV